MQRLLLLLIAIKICIGHQLVIPMCNDEGKLPDIDDLTPMDITRVKSLEQIHILSRHGSRTGDRSVLSIFPKMNISLPNGKWHCNFTTVTARDYDDYNWISLQKNYIANEQVTGGNCKDSQSIYKAVNQHKLNAHLIREYYIGDKNYNLMDKQEFQQIISDIFIKKKYNDNNTPFIKIISTDLERCYTSVSVFMTHLLELEYGVFPTPMDRYLYTYTHDEKSDPYTPQKNANCPKLNKWMKEIQETSKQFVEWINSDDVKTFYKQYEEEVGYNLYEKDGYKICSNIVFMYCAGIDLIPNMISAELFNKIYNFTLEYRRHLLHSGELSIKTTRLATMPFAWILRTLITDFIKNLEGFKHDINGYMNAEQAKMVFHSTRGISTLLMLEPLGLSNGIQPIYANLVNLEIYSRINNDYNYNENRSDKYGYNKYLFRWTNMGVFIPFPKCNDDYMNGKSTLCNLEVLINKLDEYAMYLKHWEAVCKNITDSYFEGVGVNNGNDENVMISSMSTWYLIVGIIIGVLSMWLIDRREFVKNLIRYHKYETLS